MCFSSFFFLEPEERQADDRLFEVRRSSEATVAAPRPLWTESALSFPELSAFSGAFNADKSAHAEEELAADYSNRPAVVGARLCASSLSSKPTAFVKKKPCRLTLPLTLPLMPDDMAEVSGGKSENRKDL